jgi:cellulose 1,4-beta-cellobiosidase
MNNKYGACCNEMDIWEANSVSTAFTPHPCSKPGNYRCSGTDCGDGKDKALGVCDRPGCDFNSYRMGDKKYYGIGSTNQIDTKKTMTVVTQFLTGGTGALTEIRRLYLQNNTVIQHSKTAVSALKKTYDSITDEYCADRSQAFKEDNDFAQRGGMKTMGEAGGRGMVLIFALWDDSGESAMQWLDGARWPKDASPDAPGVARGTCDGSKSRPEILHKEFADSQVVFSDIRFGDVGSTFGKGR